MFGDGLRGVALGLVQILIRGGPELGLLLLARQDFLGQPQCVRGLVVVVLGLREIR